MQAQTFLHPDAHVDGGLAFVDKQLLESQRAAVLQLMKEVHCLQHAGVPPLLLWTGVELTHLYIGWQEAADWQH